MGCGVWNHIVARCRANRLRFPSAEEALFRRSVARDVVVTYMWFSILVAVYLVIAMVPNYMTERNRVDDPFHWRQGDPRTLYFCGYAIGIVILGAGILAAVLRLRCRLFMCLNFEHPAVATIVYFMSLCYGANKFHTARLFRMAPRAVFAGNFTPYGAEMLGILAHVTLVVGACQAIPIRTHLMWVVPFLGVVIYPVVVISLGTTMPEEAMRIMIALGILSLLSHIGARFNEKQRRMKWRAEKEALERDHVAQGLEAMSWMSCDVIVRLGSDMRVTDDNPRIGAFFGQPLHGRCLKDFLVEDDRSLYDSALQKAEETGEVQSMPATFDLSFALMRVQLATVFVNGISTRFVLGVSQVDHAPKDQGQAPDILDTIDEEAEEAGFGGASAMPPDAVSVVSTAATEQVFNDIDRMCSRWGEQGQASMRRALEHVAKIGVREHWLVGTADLEVLQPPVICGAGGFGCVAVGRYRGSPVAIKVPLTSAVHGNANLIASLCNEIRLLRRIRHAHIVAFHGAAIDPDSGNLAMIFEFVEGQGMGDFVRTLHATRSADARGVTLTKVLIDVSSALTYLHAVEPAIVHGDIKTGNIKVDFGNNGIAKATLLDFGLSRLLTKATKALGGTTSWMAPELFHSTALRPAPSADVYSFGLLAYFTMTGVSVERSYDASRASGRFGRLQWPTEPMPFLGECRVLAMECLKSQPVKRPSMSDVRYVLLGWVQAAGTSYEELGPEVACHLSRASGWDEGMVALRQASPVVPVVGAGVALSSDEPNSSAPLDSFLIRLIEADKRQSPALPGNGDVASTCTASSSSLQKGNASSEEDLDGDGPGALPMGAGHLRL